MIAISFNYSSKKEKQISDKTVHINIHIFFSQLFYFSNIKQQIKCLSIYL